MTKDELERIKQAYYSGLKVQIWFNGYWENFDARDYSMHSDPFSENRLYRIVGSAYADIAEKRIAELEKENAELERKLEQTEKDLADYQFNYPTIKELQKENAELKDDNKVMADNLTKAKEIIRELLNSCFGYNSKTVNYEVKVKAEQFLKEV
jgi:hypothetical protein